MTASPPGLLYLHRAPDGSVWSLGSEPAPQRRWATLGDFIREDPRKLATKLCVIGSPENAQLILAAAALTFRRVDVQVFVCSPAILRRRQNSGDPAICLKAARTNYRQVAAGGWHPLSEFDTAQYRLVEAVKRRASLAGITKSIGTHPAWPALRFLPPFDLLKAARLLSDIVDVRWFGSSLSPDRSDTLRKFLGITERNVAFLNGADTKPPQSDELRRVSWLNAIFFGRKADERCIADHPRYFLWRLRQQKAGRAGLRAALIKGMDFVRTVWLQSVKQSGEDVFVPEYFFDLPSEAAAYAEAVAKRKRSR